MTSPTVIHLYFLRLIGALTQSALLIAGTILLAFGMLDLFNVLALFALFLAWAVFRPSAAREASALEYDSCGVGEKVDSKGHTLAGSTLPACTRERYISLSGARVRARTRKALSIQRVRFDITFAVATTLVWLAYFTFISSVIAGG